MPAKEKAVYEKPASQLDLERRQENDNESSLVVSTSSRYQASEDDGGRDFTVEDNDVEGYVGVDPIYQNYATETQMPIQADEGAEAKVFKAAAEDGNGVDEYKKRKEEEGAEANSGDGQHGGAGETLSGQAPPAAPGTSGY